MSALSARSFSTSALAIACTAAAMSAAITFGGEHAQAAVLPAGVSAMSASASAGTQQPGMAAQFVARINSERASNNRAALSTSSALTSAAQRWASSMASRNTLSHNPNLAHEVSGWHYLGENVGVGPSVSSLASAFWNSAEHRSNILDAHYTRVGVAVVDVGGKLWVAEEFDRPYGDSTSNQTSARADRSSSRTSRSATRSPLGAHPSPVRDLAGHPNRCPRAM